MLNIQYIYINVILLSHIIQYTVSTIAIHPGLAYIDNIFYSVRQAGSKLYIQYKLFILFISPSSKGMHVRPSTSPQKRGEKNKKRKEKERKRGIANNT